MKIPIQYKLVTLIVGTLVLGITIGYLAFSTKTKQLINCGDTYPLIDKDLDCGTINEKITRFANLEVQIQKVIDEEIQKNHISQASLFYRDLNTRRWFGINDDRNFFPASLLKLPLAIIYYKIAEIDPNILNQKLLLPKEPGDQNNREYFKAQTKLELGKKYTIKEMIESILIHSDNNPVAVLDTNLVSGLRGNMLHDLGIREPDKDNGLQNWEVNVRIYANIFRILYNSSFLSLEYSNRILEYLSQAEFKEGIVAGVPKGIKVAHKFGEATALNPDGSMQSRVLHDCGIVYDPKNPYILCIMTEGQDFSTMAKVIERIAKTTHNIGPSNIAED